MAFEEPLHSMYDLRLKPRLLSSIMATHLPDDRQPPRSPSELSMCVSMIRRHHLLSEPTLVEPSACPTGKPMDAHRMTVDAWVERLNVLLMSTMTEKSWAGICLLGVTCQECTRQRFLDSYVAWFQKLAVHLKPTDPLFVRGAAFASLTDLLIRLGSIGVKREGTGLSVKLVQPVLQLLSEEGSKSIWNDGIDLLSTILKFFPASLKQQSSQVEALLVAKLMDVDISASLSQKFARCLALLPKSHGDAATWNSLFRRILLAINSYLDEGFAGMEDGAMSKKVLAALMPRGQDQNWFLGGMSLAANAVTEGAKKFWQLLVPRISVLMQCCDFLLVNSFPVQVPVPLTALLALITRILLVDGSTYHAISVLGTAVPSAQQLSLCCELPALHSCALDLLHATLCGVRSQLLPRAGDIVRLLTEYFRRCGLPSLRIKLYAISKHLLMTLGVGMASELAPVLIDNSLSDLRNSNGFTSFSTNSPHSGGWENGMSAWGQLSNSRKRKDPGGMPMEMVSSLGGIDFGTEMNDSTSSFAIQIAALEALESLLTVGGSLRSDQWRADVDSVIANVALAASEGALSPSLIFEDTPCKGQSLSFATGSFQVAAYKALLASILSPCTHRPPFLSQALAVFRKGRQEAAGTEVAEFCAHALLAVEPLIHPRSLPFASTPLSTANMINGGRGSVSENMVSQVQRPALPLHGLPSPMPNSAPVASQGYPSQMVSSTLKVSDNGMQIEVEGDPYAQEDIESWIVDYGGDQSSLNDSSAMMMVEGFDEDFHTIGNVPREIVAGLGNVSARQSLADDEDRVMMSMVGDMLNEAREGTRSMTNEMMATGSFQMNGMLNGQPEIPRSMSNNIVTSGFQTNVIPSDGRDVPMSMPNNDMITTGGFQISAVPGPLPTSDMITTAGFATNDISRTLPTNDIITTAGFQTNVINTEVSRLFGEQTVKVDQLPPSANLPIAVNTEGLSPSADQLPNHAANLPISSADQVIDPSLVEIQQSVPTTGGESDKGQQIVAPVTSDICFSTMVTHNSSESDSDAIPDIVDGDPDTD